MSPAVPRKAAWIFLAVWAFAHIVYPFWFPPTGSLPAAAGLYCIVVAFGIVLLRLLAPDLEGGPNGPSLRLPGDPVLWSLLLLSAAIRLYPLTLPAHLWGAGDEAVHMGFPALPFKLWNRAVPVPVPIVFWCGLALAWTLRKRWVPLLRKLVLGAAQGRLGPTTLLLSAAAVYFALVFPAIRRFSASGYPTLIADLLRSPPLGKAVHFAVYAAIGVSDFSGRLPEFLFYCAGTLLVYQLALEYRSKTAARLSALLYLFLPPLAYYSMRGSQTHGELCFYILTAFCFARWLKHRDSSYLYWATIAASVGTLYRYTLMPMLAILSLGILGSWKKGLGKDSRRCLLLSAAAALPWAFSYFVFGLRPFGIGSHSFIEGLLEPALSVPVGVSWPPAILLAGGLFWALYRRKDPFQRFLLVWFAVYYLFIAADLGWDVRLTLPFYPPLILWAAGLLAELGEAASLAGGGALLYLLWIGLWAPVWPLKPEYTLRESLRTEYMPLKDAARALAALPEGTRLMTIDCSRGCFSFYLPRPERLGWTAVDSTSLRNLDELAKLCTEHGIQTVLYAGGTIEAYGLRKNPELFHAFIADDRRFVSRADFRLGDNRISIKDVSTR